ncbi:hypothetical protein ACIA8O_00395 [Kitasatospora sp. NPDC051853]|uniref:hypothetical protein n=1 Tax=Kitasatospora sp. NPDC051853 TaxID=3364058 RepID=UPI00378E6240
MKWITMLPARIEDRAKHADYQKALAHARAARCTPPSRFRIRWRDEAGTLHSLSVPSWRIALDLQAEITCGQAPLTLSNLIDHWSNGLAPGYPRPSRRPLDLYLPPRLGAKVAFTISQADIERLVAALHAEGRLSIAAINRILATLKRVLEFGVRHRYLSHNPALEVRPIPRPAHPGRSL